MGVAKRYFVGVYRTNTKYSKGRHTKGSQLNIERSNSILSRTIVIQASIAITTMFIKDELCGVGEGVSSFSQGDEVYGQASVFTGGSGAFGEMALANAESITHKPKSLSHVEAAALPLVGVSAWQTVVENIGLSEDQKILIHCGAGGIGSIAIQLAKHSGAYVASTASLNDKEFVQKLGADQVIDYKAQNFEDILRDYDAVFDTVGGETYRRSFKVLKKGGTIVSMLEQPNSELMNQYGVKALVQFTQANRQLLTKMAEWVDQNNIKVNIDKTFSIDEAANALDYQKDVHPRGKVVITV
jgi:alcohol dehydrogenase